MKNSEVARLLKDARYQMNPADQAQVRGMLSDLPRRRRRPMKEKLALASAAAALVLMLAFAMPPIVRAVSAFVERIFGDRLIQIEQFEALPPDEKLAQEIVWYEENTRGHNLDGAQTEFGAVTLTIASFGLHPDGKCDTQRKDGYMGMAITFSDVPAYDPNYIDFELELNGQTYSMDRADNQEYRRAGVKTTTQAGWLDEALAWSSTAFRDGVLTTYPSFAVEDWQFTDKTDMVLTGTLDGQRFSIPFTYDPLLAEAHSRVVAQETIERLEPQIEEARETLQRVSDTSVPLHITGNIQGTDFALSELAVDDQILYLSASYGGITDPHYVASAHRFWVSDVRIDGHSPLTEYCNNDKVEEGIYSTIYAYELDDHALNMPQESLISLQVCDSDKTPVPFAFKVNWQAQSVTLPEDAAQQEAWIQLSKLSTGASQKVGAEG